MNTPKMGFATQAIHSGKMKDAYGAITIPIYQTASFEFESCAQGAAVFAGEQNAFFYSRVGNPTVSMLEDTIAILEHGEAALATSSGMGAFTSVIWPLISSGDHIVADKTLYGCTFEFFSKHLNRFGVNVTFVDTTDEDALKSALTPATKVLYLETPANPNMKIVDLSKVCDIAHKYNPAIKVICDNTFASPYLQTPLTMGVDIVLHSATKYLNGHGDVIAGFVVSDAETISAARLIGLKDMTGAVMAANEAYLILRGLKTLEVRMQRHCESAMKIAEYLLGHPKIKNVYYPGLPSHIGHDIAARQMHNGFGGMISFELKGTREDGSKLLNSLELCTLAVSLGGAETLIEHPASMTHSTYTLEELAVAEISEGLVRLSVGLENVEDIIEDLDKGLARL
ncbi:MAG: methionine gamma-lyase [Firmicutes bacterium HGW-Firmicutes-16]|nr:MAG: methionine gamma-lyase [Firmicutes bacterium HGW-Firmicutes-16]